MVAKLYIIYLFFLVTTAIAIFSHKKALSRGDLWFGILIVTTIIMESIAWASATLFRNNIQVYYVYNLLQLFMITRYFTESIPYLKKKRIGTVVSLAGLVLWLSNAIFIRSMKIIGPVFLIFEAMCVIALCLTAFYFLLLEDETRLLRKSLFWVTALLVTFWSFTFLNWGLDPYSYEFTAPWKRIYEYSIYYINLFTYLGFAMVFINYKKLIPSGD